jgi:hypothetical protein
VERHLSRHRPHGADATDSTRFITLHITGNSVTGHRRRGRELSQRSAITAWTRTSWRQLAVVEQACDQRSGADFLRKLKTDKLLDDTMVLLTSNLGNASAHDNKNMPVLFAGGGFKHGQHLAFDQKDNYPLPNLYLGALQRLGHGGGEVRHQHRHDERAGNGLIDSPVRFDESDPLNARS